MRRLAIGKNKSHALHVGTPTRDITPLSNTTQLAIMLTRIGAVLQVGSVASTYPAPASTTTTATRDTMTTSEIATSDSLARITPDAIAAESAMNATAATTAAHGTGAMIVIPAIMTLDVANQITITTPTREEDIVPQQRLLSQHQPSLSATSTSPLRMRSSTPAKGADGLRLYSIFRNA
jgi:hypothetical protein